MGEVDLSVRPLEGTFTELLTTYCNVWTCVVVDLDMRYHLKDQIATVDNEEKN